MKKVLLFILVGLVLLFGFFLVYSGLFTKVVISEKMTGPYQLVYERYTGDYKETGKVMDKIYYALKKDMKVETFKGFGIYYDDPREKKKEELKSDVGIILEKKDYKKIPLIKKKYSVKKISKVKSIVAEFPFRTEFSVFIGIMKVYPVLQSYILQNKYRNTPVMEIYDVPQKKIIYVAPVLKKK
ncbi:MAG: GyrI-like domain-containing protein [Spirochaetes bacterium]|nr:GyrI-like domain-containing protein [Spirochaetota bacterium]